MPEKKVERQQLPDKRDLTLEDVSSPRNPFRIGQRIEYAGHPPAGGGEKDVYFFTFSGTKYALCLPKQDLKSGTLSLSKHSLPGNLEILKQGRELPLLIASEVLSFVELAQSVADLKSDVNLPTFRDATDNDQVLLAHSLLNPTLAIVKKSGDGQVEVVAIIDESFSKRDLERLMSDALEDEDSIRDWGFIQTYLPEVSHHFSDSIFKNKNHPLSTRIFLAVALVQKIYLLAERRLKQIDVGGKDIENFYTIYQLDDKEFAVVFLDYAFEKIRRRSKVDYSDIFFNPIKTLFISGLFQKLFVQRAEGEAPHEAIRPYKELLLIGGRVLSLEREDLEQEEVQYITVKALVLLELQLESDFDDALVAARQVSNEATIMNILNYLNENRDVVSSLPMPVLDALYRREITGNQLNDWMLEELSLIGRILDSQTEINFSIRRRISPATSSGAKIREAKEALAARSAEINDLREKLEQAHQELRKAEQIKAQLAEKEAKLAQLQEENNSLQDRVSEADKQILELEKRLSTLSQEVKEAGKERAADETEKDREIRRLNKQIGNLRSELARTKLENTRDLRQIEGLLNAITQIGEVVEEAVQLSANVDESTYRKKLLRINQILAAVQDVTLQSLSTPDLAQPLEGTTLSGKEEAQLAELEEKLANAQLSLEKEQRLRTEDAQRHRLDIEGLRQQQSSQVEESEAKEQIARLQQQLTEITRAKRLLEQTRDQEAARSQESTAHASRLETRVSDLEEKLANTQQSLEKEQGLRAEEKKRYQLVIEELHLQIEAERKKAKEAQTVVQKPVERVTEAETPTRQQKEREFIFEEIMKVLRQKFGEDPTMTAQVEENLSREWERATQNYPTSRSNRFYFVLNNLVVSQDSSLTDQIKKAIYPELSDFGSLNPFSLSDRCSI